MSLAVTSSTQPVPAAACHVGRRFRLQAYITNPVECDTNDQGNLVESQFQPDRKRTCQRVRRWLRFGYWVEVYDCESLELVAGPFDPDQPEPSYIV